MIGIVVLAVGVGVGMASWTLLPQKSLGALAAAVALALGGAGLGDFTGSMLGGAHPTERGQILGAALGAVIAMVFLLLLWRRPVVKRGEAARREPKRSAVQ